jgi:ABC-type oligopeptide transport system ATPase subunit
MPSTPSTLDRSRLGDHTVVVAGSGSGKPTLGKTIVHLLPAVRGRFTVGDFAVDRFGGTTPLSFRKYV